MKIKTMLFIAAVFSLISFTSFKPQDEDCTVCGWYVDGIKVDRIDCYNFDKLQVVLPYNSGMEGYSLINIWVEITDDKPNARGAGGENKGVLSMPGKSISTLVKNNHIIFTLFSKEYGDGTMLKDDYKGQNIQYSDMKKNILSKQRKKPIDKKITVYINGNMLTGYTEEANPASNGFIKVPQYSYNSLSKQYILKCGNNINDDASQPCSYSGTKVDFNNLGK